MIAVTKSAINRVHARENVTELIHSGRTDLVRLFLPATASQIQGCKGFEPLARESGMDPEFNLEVKLPDGESEFDHYSSKS